MEKKRYKKRKTIPIIILILGGILLCYYTISSTLTRKKIKQEIENIQLRAEQKIDSLEYENMVKDIIIYDSIVMDDILELEHVEKDSTIRKPCDSARYNRKKDR